MSCLSSLLAFPRTEQHCAAHQVSAGLSGRLPAVALMWRGATADVTLSRARDRLFPFIRKLTHELTFKRQPLPLLPTCLVAKATSQVHAISTTVCAESAWPFVAAGISLWSASVAAVGSGPLVGAAGEAGAEGPAPAVGGADGSDSRLVSQGSGASAVPPVPPRKGLLLGQPLQWEADCEVRSRLYRLARAADVASLAVACSWCVAVCSLLLTDVGPCPVR